MGAVLDRGCGVRGDCEGDREVGGVGIAACAGTDVVVVAAAIDQAGTVVECARAPVVEKVLVMAE